MNKILVEVSVGELFDKISILEIKKEKIKDPDKLKHINEEYNCKICNYSGNTEAHLKTNIEVKHSDYIYDCDRWTELEAEIRVHPNQK